MCQKHTATYNKLQGGEKERDKKRKRKKETPQYIVWYICSDYSFIYTTKNTSF